MLSNWRWCYFYYRYINNNQAGIKQPLQWCTICVIYLSISSLPQNLEKFEVLGAHFQLSWIDCVLCDLHRLHAIFTPENHPITYSLNKFLFSLGKFSFIQRGIFTNRLTIIWKTQFKVYMLLLIQMWVMWQNKILVHITSTWRQYEPIGYKQTFKDAYVCLNWRVGGVGSIFWKWF